MFSLDDDPRFAHRKVPDGADEELEDDILLDTDMTARKRAYERGYQEMLASTQKVHAGGEQAQLNIPKVPGTFSTTSAKRKHDLVGGDPTEGEVSAAQITGRKTKKIKQTKRKKAPSTAKE